MGSRIRDNLMGLGPVFHFERITTARRARYYGLRVVYGLFLFYALWQEYLSWRWMSPAVATIKNMSLFAQAAFLGFAGGQGFALLVLTPAMVAGVIADERQRKTLDYLLASQLSSTEIVMGKLAARLLHLGVLMAIGLPVVCLVALFGGLDPWDVLAVYAGTTSVTLFVASLSIAISTVARRPREAILVAYILLAAWLLLPMMIEPIGRHLEWPLRWVGPVNDLVLLTHPLRVWGEMRGAASFRFSPQWGAAAWVTQAANHAFWSGLVMVGLQLVLSALFLILAVWRIRRLKGGGAAWGWRRRRGLGRLLDPVPERPGCGDDPMLWKERHAATGGLSWLSSRPVVLILTVLLGCYLYDTARPAFAGMIHQGFASPQAQGARSVLNGALRESSTLLFGLLMLAVASAGAVSVTSEREQDTWVSLRTTLVSEAEIVRAKLIGAVWGARRLVLVLGAMWSVGLLAGAIHPAGVLAATVALGIYAWFTAALGVFLSIKARNSTRALVAAVAVLLMLNGGYLVLFAGFRDGSSWVSRAGVTPFVEWVSLLSYDDVAGLRTVGTALPSKSPPGGHAEDAVVMYLVSLALYGLGALALTSRALGSFRKAADRA
jgi:ABC-type transport system involved in multi-copper enzyme maturation permease subunit